MESYAKPVQDSLEYPTDAEFVHIPNWRTHDALLRSRGYLPLSAPAAVPEGKVAVPLRWHVETRTRTVVEPRQAYVEEGGRRRMVMRDETVTFDDSFIAVDEWEYADPPATAEAPVTVCTRYEFVNALKTLGMYDALFAAYQGSPELQFYWSTVNELDRDNADFQRFAAVLEADDATVDAVFAAVAAARAADAAD